MNDGELLLVLWDLDGTLVKSFMQREDRDYDIVEVLPHAKWFINMMRNNMPHCRHVVVTNQRGAAFGLHTKEQFQEKIETVEDTIGWEFDGVRVCFADHRGKEKRQRDGHERAKPSPIMVNEALEAFHCPPEKALFIGDSSDDSVAAHRAGVRFMPIADVDWLFREDNSWNSVLAALKGF